MFTIQGLARSEDPLSYLMIAGVFGESSFYVIQTKDGDVLVTHGDVLGRITDLDLAMSGRFIGIICCYPAYVKQLYPSLPIMGDWKSSTYTRSGGYYSVQVRGEHESW